MYVYDLPQGAGTTHKVSDHLKKFELKDASGATINMKASDICFANNYLFIMFDGGGTQDEIHLFSIRPDGKGLDHAGASYLPVLPGWNKKTDFEGLTIDGSNLYLSVDASKSTKLVYQFTDYSISKFV